MARKLKSDKLLFIAMLLLVCTSVVMVYSASAVVLSEKGESPYLFLFKQGTFALLGLFFMQLVMRIDYRTYRQPVVIWTGLVLVGLALVAVLFGRPINGATRWLEYRAARRAAVGARQDRGHHLHRRAARAAHGAHRRAGADAAADRRRDRSDRPADPRGAGPRHGRRHRRDRVGHDLRGRHQLSLHRAAGGAGASGALPPARDVRVPLAAGDRRSWIPGPRRRPTAIR